MGLVGDSQQAVNLKVNKTGNIRVKVTLRSVWETIFVVEMQ
jgi:hypothetical protein